MVNYNPETDMVEAGGLEAGHEFDHELTERTPKEEWTVEEEK